MDIEVYSDLKEIVNLIDESFNGITPLYINISVELLDNLGMNMAIIIDAILKKGYMPDGYEQFNGYKKYKYINN